MMLTGVPPGFTLETMFGTSLLVGVILFAFFALVLLWKNLKSAQLKNEDLQTQVREMHAQIEMQKSIIHAEPNILVQWSQKEHPVLVNNTLGYVKEIPQDRDELVNFVSWLSDSSGYELEDALLNLIAQGEPFNLVITTRQGMRLEAEGRTSGGRAILKLRDLAGAIEDFAQLKDEHDRVLRRLLDARKFLDRFPLPVWFRDAQGKIEWVNAAYAETVGISDSALTISAGAELLENRHLEALQVALEEKGHFHEKTRLVLDGEQKFFEVGAVSFGEEGSAGYAMDIDERESTEALLSRYIDVFGATLDQMSTAVAIFNTQNMLEFYNEAFVNLWGLDRNFLEEQPSASRILDELRLRRLLPSQTDYKEWKEDVLNLHQRIGDARDRWDLPDGRTVFVCELEGYQGGSIYCFENRTDQLTLKQQYHTLNTVQRESLNALSEGVAVFASNGRLKLFNTAFARMWHFDMAMLEEEPHIEKLVEQCRQLYDDPEFWKRVYSAVTSIEEKRNRFTRKMLRNDESVLLFGRVPMPEGSTMFTFYDITDSEQKEKALRERNEALESADLLKNSFIANISYELRTPLTSIIGFSELLLTQFQGSPLDKHQAEYIRGILSSGRQLEGTINDILDLASIDAGKLELVWQEIDSEDLLLDVNLEMTPVASRQDVILKLVPIPVESRTFVADEERMKQILLHLLSNAIGCSPQGGEVLLACHREGENIVFSVRDQGSGIPEELKDSVFERFESSAIAGRHRGAGLGLAMVKSLVELHGGDVSLASAEGKGTVATVRIPRLGMATRTPDSPEEGGGKKIELLELEDIVQDAKQKREVFSGTGTDQ